MTSYYIGIDIGGTKILAAVATPEGRIIARSKRKTAFSDAGDLLDPMALARHVAGAAQDAVDKAGLRLRDIKAVGVGTPGPTNIHTGRMLNAVNLPAWRQGFDVGPVLSGMLEAPVFADNDVNVGLLGEATFGAARGFDDVVGLFVGTGLGGAIILDGRLRRGFRWGAGEVGHTLLHYPGKKPLDIEEVASRGAISKRLEKALRAGKAPLLAEILQKRKNNRITSGVIRKALEAGDPATVKAVTRAQEAIGILIASLTNFLDPQAFVLGGGLVGSLGPAFLQPIDALAREHFFVKNDADKVMIVPASLGDDSGALGAVALARNATASGKRKKSQRSKKTR